MRRPDIHRRRLHRHQHEARRPDGDARLRLGMRRAIDKDDIVGAGLALDLGGDTPTGDRRDLDGGVAAEPLPAQVEPGGKTALRIDVDDGDALTRRPGQCEMRGERRLAGTALALRDGDDGRWHRRPFLLYFSRADRARRNDLPPLPLANYISAPT